MGFDKVAEGQREEGGEGVSHARYRTVERREASSRRAEVYFSARMTTHAMVQRKPHAGEVKTRAVALESQHTYMIRST